MIKDYNIMNSGKIKFISILFLVLCMYISGCATVTPQYQMRPTGGIYHVVGSGQTLWSISKAYNVDMHEIMRVNNIKDPNYIGVGQRLFIPKVVTPLTVESYRPTIPQSIEKIIGPKRYVSKWRYITLHHSATTEGNAEIFDRNHRKRRMGGLFYHFVIGNGCGSGDGEIEVGFRWREQKYVNRNYDIQICLVGNFNKQNVSKAQFDSLVKMISLLCRQYKIPVGNIRRHKDIKGQITECPGNNFPFYRLLSELRKNL